MHEKWSTHTVLLCAADSVGKGTFHRSRFFVCMVLHERTLCPFRMTFCFSPCVTVQNSTCAAALGPPLKASSRASSPTVALASLLAKKEASSSSPCPFCCFGPFCSCPAGSGGQLLSRCIEAASTDCSWTCAGALEGAAHRVCSGTGHTACGVCVRTHLKKRRGPLPLGCAVRCCGLGPFFLLKG